jgi:DNA-3-methyladenine glycosylase II
MPIDQAATSRFHLVPRGPFSTDAVRELQCGFLRGSRACGRDRSVVKLAFPRDGTFEVVGVTLRQRGGGLHGEVVGARDGAAVGRQVARVLGLDHDATPFARLLDRDPALRAAAGSRPGFRPVVAYSPFVMGGWAVLTQRLRMSQAAALQVKLAEATGDVVELDGDRVASFPRPQSLLALDGFPGIPAEKWRRLQVMARAALDGELDRDRLLGCPPAEARQRLMRLHGVGPWTAEAILVRGCGPTDLLPLAEPAVHAAVGRAYGLARIPDDATVTAIAETWRPFRTWVTVLLMATHFQMNARTARAA